MLTWHHLKIIRKGQERQHLRHPGAGLRCREADKSAFFDTKLVQTPVFSYLLPRPVLHRLDGLLKLILSEESATIFMTAPGPSSHPCHDQRPPRPRWPLSSTFLTKAPLTSSSTSSAVMSSPSFLIHADISSLDRRPSWFVSKPHATLPAA